MLIEDGRYFANRNDHLKDGKVIEKILRIINQ